MARDFSKVSSNVWNSRKFWSLPDDITRYAYLYLLTNDHCNSAGCYKFSIGYMAGDLKWTMEASRKAIDSLTISGLIVFDEGENTVLLTNWEAFNEPTNPKHAQGLLAEISRVASRSLKSQCFHALLERLRARGFDRDIALKKSIDLFLKAFPKPPPTEIETEKEIEKERREEEKETETRENSRAPNGDGAVDGASPSAQEDKNHLIVAIESLEAKRRSRAT